MLASPNRESTRVANRLDCKKRVVEDCIKLSVVDLHAKDIFSMRFKECWISWISDDVNHKVYFSIEESPGQAMALRFSQPSIRCLIQVTSTRTPFGGRRFWFRCPVVNNGVRCGRRTACLYLPPGESIFGCRFCHDLTYTSCQTHDKRVDWLIRHEDSLIEAILSDNHRRRMLGTKAYCKAITRIRRLYAR